MLLCLGCCHAVKGHLGREYSTAGRPFLHRVAAAGASLRNPFTPLNKARAGTELAPKWHLHKVRAVGDAVTHTFINKHTQV